MTKWQIFLIFFNGHRNKKICWSKVVDKVFSNTVLHRFWSTIVDKLQPLRVWYVKRYFLPYLKGKTQAPPFSIAQFPKIRKMCKSILKSSTYPEWGIRQSSSPKYYSSHPAWGMWRTSAVCNKYSYLYSDSRIPVPRFILILVFSLFANPNRGLTDKSTQLGILSPIGSFKFTIGDILYNWGLGISSMTLL